MGKKESKSKSSVISSVGSLSNRRIYIFIFAFCFLLYGNSIKNGFSLDDEFVSYNHQQVKKGLRGIPEIFASYYTSGAQTHKLYGYRPIAKATFAIEYSIFGENPHASHFFNIVIYAFIGVVIFKSLKKWLENYNIVLPLLITMLFLAHPVHSEVVVSIKNREVLLAFLGSFMMFHFAIRYIEYNKIRDIAWANFFGIFAFLSKPETAPAIFFIPFLSYFFTNASVKRGILVPMIPWAITAGFVTILHFAGVPIFGRDASIMEYFDNPLYFTGDWSIRLGVAFNSLFYYLRMLIVHYPLVYFYGYNMIPVESFFSFGPVLSFIIYLGMGVFAIWNLKRKYLPALGITWYLIHIALFANIVVPAAGIVAERFVFAGSFGFCIVAAYYLLKISKVNFETPSKGLAMNSTLAMISGVIFVLFAGQTIARNNDWKDKLTLFRHDIRHLDNSVKAHEILATSLMNERNYAKTEEERWQLTEEAVLHYKRALEIYPDFAMANNNLGIIYANLYNDCEKAIHLYLKAVQVDSSFAEAMINLGFCYSRNAKTDEAIKMFEEGIRVGKEKFIRSYTALIALYFEKNEIEKANRLFQEAVKYFPDSELPYVEMGNQFIARRDSLKAVKYFEGAVRIKPDPRLADFVSNYYKRGDTLRINKLPAK